MKARTIWFAVAVAIALVASMHAGAQAWPSKPLRLAFLTGSSDSGCKVLEIAARARTH